MLTKVTLGSRIGNCCGKRPTGICWKLACAVQPEPGLQPLSWGEHVLVAWSSEGGFYPYQSPRSSRYDPLS